MKRTLMAAAAAAVLMFTLAGLYTGVLARSFIATHVESALLRQPTNLAVVFVGYAVLAALMTLIYGKVMNAKPSTAWSDFQFGMVAGICWLIPYSLVLFGVYRFPYLALPLDFGWALLEQGMGGLVIGLFLRNRLHRSSAGVNWNRDIYDTNIRRVYRNWRVSQRQRSARVADLAVHRR
jgi:hypothetical protein